MVAHDLKVKPSWFPAWKAAY